MKYIIHILKNIKRFCYNHSDNEFKKTKIVNNTELNADKTFYIIRRTVQAGFFSNFLFILGHMIYADKKGYIPVVDMKNYITLYNEENAINGTMNAWEYYYEQEFDLEEVYKSKNVILSDDLYLSQYVPSYVGKYAFCIDKQYISNINSYINKYICMKPNVYEFYSQLREEMNNRCVLGVHIRGTDMNVCQDHPQPLGVETFIENIKHFIKYNHVDKILLCTDEQYIESVVNEEFGDLVICSNSYRAKEGATSGIHLEKTIENVRENHKYMLGLEVLRDMMALSECDYLMCGKSNVPLVAMIYNNNNYKQIKLIV